jgi:hypothetical protein
MREVEKEGVLIDVCPDCKGVWLDRGELEKLMSDVRQERREYSEWYQERSRHSADPYRGDRHYDSKHDSPYYKHKKKKSVLDRLGDLFD